LFNAFLSEIINLWLDVSPYLLLGIVIAGFMHLSVGREFITRQLGKGGPASIIKATLIGIPLPVCSCGVIPLAAALRKDGAHRSSVLSFMVSTPTTGIDSIMATYSLLGPLFAFFRPLAALVSGILVGLADYFIEGRKEKNIPFIKHEHVKIKPVFKLKEFFRYSFVEIPQDIGRWLIIGTIIGAAISAFIPKGLFSHYLGFPLDYLAAIGIGIPLYVCASGSIPIAVSLMAKGISAGAVLAFLITGPATNAITLSFVRAKLGKKSFYIYLASIIFTAVTLGLIFDKLWIIFRGNPGFFAPGGEMVAMPFKSVCGIFLLIIIINSLFRKEQCAIKPDIVIYVDDIHCRQCKIALESKISELAGIEEVFVDIGNKKIIMRGIVEKEKVFEKIKEAGYHPNPDRPQR